MKQRVLDAVRELDYSVNLLACSLRSRSTWIIGMPVPGISDPFHAAVVRVVEAAPKAAGYSLLLGNLLYDRPEEQSRYLQLLRTNQP